MGDNDKHDSTKHIIQSLLVNVIIAVAKIIAAVFTGSGAMLAEAIHSSADCSNQVLLLIGVKRAAKAPDAQHPLGYGRSMYFWSFLVALLLFSGGGVFSVYEGIHKLIEPEPVENHFLAFGILLFSLALEGWATWGNLKEMKERRGTKGLIRYLQDTKDSDLVVVFGENSAAVMGLAFAMITLAISYVTHEPKWDAVGSLLVGLVLIGVAVFLAIEVMSLLIGEAADPTLEGDIRAVALAPPAIVEVLEIITMQQGPGEVVVALKFKFADQLTVPMVVDEINAFEVELRAKRPEAKWIFVEPDTHAHQKNV